MGPAVLIVASPAAFVVAVIVVTLISRRAFGAEIAAWAGVGATA